MDRIKTLRLQDTTILTTSVIELKKDESKRLDTLNREYNQQNLE